MKKSKLPMTKILMVLILFLGATGILYLLNKDEKKALSYDHEYLTKQVQIVEDKNNDEVMEVDKSESISVFTTTYQQVIEEKINQLMKNNNYTFEKPLFIHNPFGTGSLSYYLAFHNEEENLSLSYTIETDGYQTFSRTLKQVNDTKDYAYQLIGFLPGKTSWLTLTLKNEQGEIVQTKRITVKAKALTNIDMEMNVKDGESKVALSDGFYALLGHDKAYNSNIYLFDNDGVLRNELVLKGYRGDRIIELDDTLLYSYSTNGFIQVNRLGKIEKFYTLKGYEMHHDYVYDEAHNQLVVLVNKKGKDTIEDEIVTLDLETGKITHHIDMTKYLKEFYQNAVKPDKNTYGGDELDWLYLNSLQVVGDDILINSRELSLVIYLEDAFSDNVKIKYLIGDTSVVEGTSYEDLLLTKVGDFVDMAGEHSITYKKKSTQQDGVYTLQFYNNNYQGARTRPDFDWKNYEGTGTYEEGDASYYYEYEVDENNKTYKLVKKFKVPYSSIVSNIQQLGSNYVTSSGMSHCYDEYDHDGNLIREFSYTAKKYAYRVFKYDFKGFLFE